MRSVSMVVVMFLCVSGFVSTTAGQSSSLYLRQEPTATAGGGAESILSPTIAANSFTAVRIPDPRSYSENDLVTVIIRESFKTDLKASLETDKALTVESEVTDFVDLKKLLELVVQQDDLNGGVNPKIGVDASNEFDGSGKYSRSESMTGRMTARIADVKPNGTIVIEAKQTIMNDREELTIVLTGTCRAADITVDNTVLSTELYDLHLDKQHKGELKQSTRKGFITKFIEGLFSF